MVSTTPGRSVRAARRLGLLAWTYAYAATLYGVYVWAVEPAFGYQGFLYYPPTALEHLLVLTFATVPALLVPQRLNNLSGYFYLLVYYLVYLPTLLVAAFRYPGFRPEFLGLYALLLVAMLPLGAFAHLPATNVPRPQLGRLSWNTGLLAFVLLVYAALVAKFGLRPPPSPLDPYDVRLAARELGALTGYLLRIASNVLAPAVMVWGLFSRPPRRTLLIGASLALFVLVYSFDGTKSTLFSPILIATLWYVYRRRTPTSRLLALGVVLIWLGVLADAALGKSVFTAIGIRRLALMPGLLTTYYYEYFVILGNPLFLFSHSFLGSFFQNPYGTTPAFQIAHAYFASESMSANANFLADAIANLGAVGVPLLAMLAGGYVYLVRALSGGREELALLAASIPVFSLTNTSFFTTLLTHGLFLATLVVWFFPRSYLQPRQRHGAH